MALDATALCILVCTKIEESGNLVKPSEEAFIHALCEGIIEHITTDGIVTITVSGGGLQTTTTDGNPTGAPAQSQDLPGTIT